MTSSEPNAPPVENRGRAGAAFLAGTAVALFALTLYRATLLPGVDFGDTGSFQTTVGSALLTPRVGYPVYFALGGAFLRLSGAEPAHALNLATAIEGSLACGLFVIVAAELTGSLAAAAAAALLFAVSYTFWSQSVIAEVYALHAFFMLASLWLLLRWEREPTARRLAAFFLCYALGFGNHLSMILLAPAFTFFLVQSAPGGWRSLLAPRTVALAAACALAGASTYLWNLRTLWFELDPPRSIGAALGTFWFDVTKSDWRDSMVLEVPRALLSDHFAMYWFDLRQQFGVAGVAVAAAGAVALARSRPRRALLLVALYIVCFAFAFSYNVGDAHVFYIPSHIIVALLAACGAAGLGRIAPRWSMIPALALAGYAGLRGYHDYPALDRSGDGRPAEVLRVMTAGLDDRRAIFLVDLNWQVANGLSYVAKVTRPGLAVARMRDVLLYAPALVADNLAGGRSVALTPSARRLLEESYAPLFQPVADYTAPSLAEVVLAVEPRTRYVLCVLKPARDLPLDGAALDAALRTLSGGAAVVRPAGDYFVVAGVAGSPPVFRRAADRPFSATLDLDGVPTQVRMESWLASDTIRRMGFGHVIAGRHHALIVERGISFASLGPGGVPLHTAYFSGIFALPDRYLIR